MAQSNTKNENHERHGLFILHPNSDEPYDESKYLVDIVAIHGLGGHPLKTWTEKEDRHLWLRDSLPVHVPEARIMSFGYDSVVLFGKSRSQICDYALDLANRLEIFRQSPQERCRPLLFICHSLGGVVFKEFLVQVTLNKDLEHLAQSVAGVVFLGCPHRGSRVASHARLLSKLINNATLGTGARSDLLKTLQVSSAELEAVSQHARYPLKSIVIVSFYEQLPTGRSMVVEPFSAILGLPNERAVPVTANHRGLAHVSPKKPHQYLPIWSSIKQLAEGCVTSIEADNRELLDALFCLDPKAAQMRPRQSQNGTCEWIFNHPKYVKWLESTESPLLLLTGLAGSGKSVLTRCVAEHLQSCGLSRDSDSGYLVVSLFCSYMDTVLNTVDTVLRTLLHQLIQLNPRCGILVRNRVENRKLGGTVFDLSTKKMWEALQQVLSMQTMSRVIIVIDAIEELGAAVAAAVLAGLSEIATNLHRQHIALKAFISSRPSTELSSNELEGLEILHLGDVDMERDIERYLRSSIDDLKTENKSFNASITPTLEQRIVTSISNTADGMFLVAVLTWEDFQTGLFWNEKTITEKLDDVLSLGTSMVTFYDKLIERIDDSVLEDVLQIFAILAASARPMTEVEIGTILGICRSRGPIHQSTDFEPYQNLNAVIEREVPHLISLQDDGTMAFIHLSFKDYLESQSDFEDIIEMGRQTITKACLIYLKLQDMLESASIETDHTELTAQYPFLDYASSHFLWHIEGFTRHDPMWLLFSDTAGEKSIWSLNSLWPEGKYYGTTPLRFVLSNLPESAALSLANSFEEHGYDMDERWSSCPGRALQYCCMNADTEFGRRAALLLLDLDANPNLPKDPFRSNLGLALAAEAWELYDELLCHPMTDLSARNEQGGTMLHDQVKCGPIERISEMLDLTTETDLNAQDRDGYTPLHLATSLGREDVVRMLLNKPGIRLDLADRIGRTPLTLATYWGLKSMALVLIEHSEAFPIARGGHLSALVLAAKHGDKDICERLLAACGYRNLCFHLDMSGKGVLHHAAVNEWGDIIEACLRRGGLTVNIDQIDHSGRSALHYASQLGNYESCQALIQGGASLTLQDRLGRTAVQAAADAGFKECLILLLESGRVDPSQRDIEGRSLVHWVATLDCVDTMELVSEMPGAKLDQKDRHGKTPIDIAFICKNKYVGMFLANKVPHTNIYSWDYMYDTPFVEHEVEDDYCYASYQASLLERNARRQKLANEEHMQVQTRYPCHLWALVPYVSEETETKIKDSEKPNRKKDTKDKTSKGRSSKEKSAKEKPSKDRDSKGKPSNPKSSKDKSSKKKTSKSVKK
ncbi:hypothetical protein HYE67_010015 [Fusarium culmorum]|uniref:Nephrocystin 3-like N-terminal domain-containing protein n=1 Tax=Fusarium culmorum TaxID=5516 RepID=A0A7S8DFS0_FUSCU|nr:hypothetical protein HYE67_010015 [Fusarium culmorum]